MRRLTVLIRHLPPESALVRALNNGKPGWTLTDHLVADLWVQTVKASAKDPKKVKDHPVRAEMVARHKSAASAPRLAQLKAEYEARKQRRHNKSEET